MKKLIKTELKTYRLDMNIDSDVEQYENIKSLLKKQGTKFNTTLAFQYPKKVIESGTIEIDFNYVFDNQFNTSSTSELYPDFRLWDHTECIFHNAKIKQGYYIIMTDEIRDIRENTYKCGYCGKQEYKSVKKFCIHCIDSEYLNESELHLLRMKKVNDNSNRQKLSDEELKILKPLYIHAQTVSTDSRNKAKIEKQYVDNEKQYKNAIDKAEKKYHGFKWLMDNNVNIDNCIYYDHTKMFSFGWKNKISESVGSELEKKLVNFPYDYEIKNDE